MVQVGYADANGVAVADEGESLAVCPSGDELALEDHIGGLHVDLVELAQGTRSVLDDVRNGVYCGLEIDVVRRHEPSDSRRRSGSSRDAPVASSPAS